MIKLFFRQSQISDSQTKCVLAGTEQTNLFFALTNPKRKHKVYVSFFEGNKLKPLYFFKKSMGDSVPPPLFRSFHLRENIWGIRGCEKTFGGK